ncbi:MAG: DUF6473 family protein [Paracoccaceae bacterium]
MSNRFYAVHPRRNDRFLRASNLLKTIYREVDFTEFNFTRHLLTRLKELSEDKFMMVEQELKAWVARMKTLVSKIEPEWCCSGSPTMPRTRRPRAGRRQRSAVRRPPVLAPCAAATMEVVVDADDVAASRGSKGSSTPSWCPGGERHARRWRTSWPPGAGAGAAPIHLSAAGARHSIAPTLPADLKGPPESAGLRPLRSGLAGWLRALPSVPAPPRTGRPRGRSRRPGRSAPPRPC